MRAHPRLLSGFIIPLGDVDVPDEEQYLPNSPREYRAGYHEGIDFPTAAATPVLAAKAGTIVRVDTAFAEWTPDEEEAEVVTRGRVAGDGQVVLARAVEKIGLRDRRERVLEQYRFPLHVRGEVILTTRLPRATRTPPIRM